MKASLKKKLWAAALLVMAFGADFARAQVDSRVDNWTVPELASKAVDLTRPVSFVGMLPCRIVDTRGSTGPYGGPALPASTQRTFDLDSGPCTGIPAGVAAYSLNFTVTQTQGFGDLRVWPTGPNPPLVSTLNYVPNQTIANAAIVPASINGSISVVAGVSGTHLIIDINGYFTDEPNAQNYWDFSIQVAGGPVLFARNNEPAASGSTGLTGRTSSTGNYSFGVDGNNLSAGTSELGGVRGTHGPVFAMPFYGPVGVRGNSRDFLGVAGVSQDSFGVGGSNVTGGAEQTWAGLACSDTVAVCGSGTVNVSGLVASLEPHATDASRVIKYAALEGNEAGTYFRGRAKFEKGIAHIPVPEDFRMVTNADGLSIQVTPIGEMATYAVVRIDLNGIVVKASRNVEFFYLVQGMRKGYGDFTPIVEEAFFVPRSADYRMPGAFSTEAKRKLIANGTYNADGTVNMETAKRLGWTEKWKGGSVPKKE